MKEISLKLVTRSEYIIPMQPSDLGYWKTFVDNVVPGTLYMYTIDRERDRPDPVSNYQPHGVHNASQVIDHATFEWHDQEWKGVDLSEMIMYEIHVGTFTPQGTFDAIIPRLDDLQRVGINALEIMPVAQFPGERNWGYDGVYPFAVQNSYGGPDGLKKLVNECHKRGIAVILDVVYNHLGPEGNYLWDYGPYFTDRYMTPWGRAINYDGEHSNEVRRYFIENAIFWLRNYHIDALRLDAIHGIYDMSARPFLLELSEAVMHLSNTQGRKLFLIAESDLNNSLVAKPSSRGGMGLDCLWCDDFHHSLHTLITGENNGYYMDFGKLEHLEKSLKEGFVYSGQYSAFRKRNHGNSSEDLDPGRFIVFSQNHDQIGNRLKGERFASLSSFEALKLSAGLIILSQYIPLLFMGEEYAETAPFLYFVSHSDAGLIEGIREGRKKEFESFGWDEYPPDPQNSDTFVKSKINWDLRYKGKNKIMCDFYEELIRLRKTMHALSSKDKRGFMVLSDSDKKTISFLRKKLDDKALLFYNLNKSESKTNAFLDGTRWKLILDSSDKRWDGPGSLLPNLISNREEIALRAESFALYSNR